MALTCGKTVQLTQTTDQEEAEVASTGTLVEDSIIINQTEEDPKDIKNIKDSKDADCNTETSRAEASREEALVEAEANPKNSTFSSIRRPMVPAQLQHKTQVAAVLRIGTAMPMRVTIHLISFKEDISIDNQLTQQWKCL